MSELAFLLLIAICLGLIYLVHRYFGKEQFYIIGIIYSVVSFIMSFKIVEIFGVNVNANIIFNSGLFLMLYYFVNRYNEKESRKFIITNLICSLMCVLFLMVTAFMMPSVYDKMSIFYQRLLFDNIPLLVLYPISLTVSMFLGEYCFKELKKEDKNRTIKTILTIFGIVFVDVIVFVYFSYAFIIRFDTAIKIAIDNYLVKICIMVVSILIMNKLFMVRKVK